MYSRYATPVCGTRTPYNIEVQTYVQIHFDIYIVKPVKFSPCVSYILDVLNQRSKLSSLGGNGVRRDVEQEMGRSLSAKRRCLHSLQ